MFSSKCYIQVCNLMPTQCVFILFIEVNLCWNLMLVQMLMQTFCLIVLSVYTRTHVHTYTRTPMHTHAHTCTHMHKARESATHVALFYLPAMVLRAFVTWRKLSVAPNVWEARRDRNVWQVLDLNRVGKKSCSSVHVRKIKETQVKHLIRLS